MSGRSGRLIPSLDQKVLGPVVVTHDNGVAYAANDQVGNLLTFTDAVRPGKIGDAPRSGQVIAAILTDSSTSTAVEFKLHIYVAPVTQVSAENAALDFSDAQQRAYYRGQIRFQTADAGTFNANRTYTGTIVNGQLPFTVPDFDADGNAIEDIAIYGQLQATGAWTGGSTTDLAVTLTVVRD